MCWPLLLYKNTSRHNDVVERYMYGNSSGCRHKPWPGACGRNSAGLFVGWPFLARARFHAARGVLGVEEVKRRGSPPLQRSRALSNISHGTSRDPILNARQRIGLSARLTICSVVLGFKTRARVDLQGRRSESLHLRKEILNKAESQESQSKLHVPLETRSEVTG